nr:MAG TPA: hypothetical protein [Caudoviricetes sp.]
MLLKKRFGSDRSVGRKTKNATEKSLFFKLIYDSGCYPSVLIIFMHIQPVKITIIIHISEADNYTFFRNNCMMFRKRCIPIGNIYVSSSPRIKLWFCIIF